VADNSQGPSPDRTYGLGEDVQSSGLALPSPVQPAEICTSFAEGDGFVTGAVDEFTRRKSRMSGRLRYGQDAHRMARPRWLRCVTLAGLGIALALSGGCVTTGPLEWIRNGFKVGPNYCRPPAPLAPDWIDAQDPNVQSRHLQFADWWSVFQDPALNSLIDTAYAQNLNLRVLGTRVLEARAQQAITVGNIFPQLQQATGHYSRINLSQTTFNNPSAFSSLATTPIPPGVPIGNFYADWLFGFNMSWELDFWGRFRRNIETANATLDASVENFDDALVTLLGDVATAYVQFRVFQQRIRIARDNVRIQEGVLGLAQQRFNIGTGTKLDVEQARTVLEQTRSTIPALQIGLRQAGNTLCTLLGIPPRDLVPDLGPGPDLGSHPMPNTPVWVAAGIPADLLRRRPDVRSAERQVAAQSAQIGVAEADLYPAIVINGTLGWESAAIAKLFEPQSFFGNITPTFNWNLLNYGRILNNVRLQDARTQELVAAYQNKVLTASREVENALVGFLRSQEQARDLARSVEAAAAATKLGVEQYKTGTIDFNRVFNLETTLVTQQDQLAVAQGNIALNLINAYRALGGGWELRYQKDGCGPAPKAPEPAPAVPTPEALPAPLPDKPAMLGAPSAAPEPAPGARDWVYGAQ
jgi:NodT family efflux transporter outer membrane factor (OMF) lipoprotein